MAELSVQKMVLTPLSNALDSFLGGLGGGGGASAAPAAASSGGGGSAGCSADFSAAAGGGGGGGLFGWLGGLVGVGRRPRRRSFPAAPAAGRWRRGCPTWWASSAGPSSSCRIAPGRSCRWRPWARSGAAAKARLGKEAPVRGSSRWSMSASPRPTSQSFRRSRAQVAGDIARAVAYGSRGL